MDEVRDGCLLCTQVTRFFLHFVERKRFVSFFLFEQPKHLSFFAEKNILAAKPWAMPVTSISLRGVGPLFLHKHGPRSMLQGALVRRYS